MAFRKRIYLTLAMSAFIAYSSGYSHDSSSPVDEWRTAYNGYGEIRSEGKNRLILAPKASTQASETHSALAISQETELHPVTDFKISFRYQVREQLRTPASDVKPWETLWLFFNYRPDGQFKKTNYLLLKENGIEIGKAWGEVEQKFIYTAKDPSLKDLHEWHQLTVIKRAQTISVQIDRLPATEIELSSSVPLYTEAGAIGLYSEDAHVRIENIHYESLSDKLSPPNFASKFNPTQH